VEEDTLAVATRVGMVVIRIGMIGEGIGEGNLSIKRAKRQVEKILIQKALKKTGGNRTQAAKLLEISHVTLLYKMKEYKLRISTGKAGRPPLTNYQTRSAE